MFHTVDVSFNKVSQLVEDFIEWAGSRFIDFPGDGDANMMFPEILSDFPTAKGFIPYQSIRPESRSASCFPLYGTSFHELVKCGCLMPLAGSKFNGHQSPITLDS